MAVVSADQLQLSIVEEVTPGVTPATPAFLVLPVTSESLAGNATTQTSSTLNPYGQVSGSILTNMDTGGDISIEFADSDAVRLLLESVLSENFVAADGAPGPVPPGNEPGVAPLVADIGTTKISFTAEVRFPDPINIGQFLYQRFTNCIVDTFNITADPENPVTASFTLLGGVPAVDTTMIAGATYVPAGNQDVFRGPDFLTLQFGGITTTLPCMNSFNLVLNANLRGQKCLGTLGNSDVIIGQRDPNGSASVYFIDNSILQAMIDQTEFALTVEMKTLSDSYFAAFLPRCKLTQNPVVATGTGADVVNDSSFQGAYDETEQTSLRLWVE